MSDYYDEKLSAADIFNKAEMKFFHSDMKAYLIKNNVPGAEYIINGKTADGNLSVNTMKEFTKATGLTIDEVKDLVHDKQQLIEQINNMNINLADKEQLIDKISMEFDNIKSENNQLKIDLENTRDELQQAKHRIAELERISNKDRTSAWGEKNTGWGEKIKENERIW